ncbi:MAG: right-handed parallel beta-helix repeat-containing protein [Acidobacteriia bacterium]|nr:right-handed parallel beta-helix repeat-containing protein [Terriglobia bacterium]
MRRKASVYAFFVWVAITTASQPARATNITVNCDRRESIRQAVKLLAGSNPQGPNTISVRGSCVENILIQGMDRLTLITKKGASITDRSAGNSVVVDIENSHSVTLQGFSINGGAGGVVCNAASVCYLTGNTIQDSAGAGVGVSGGSHAFLESNVIQSNGFRGSTVTDGSQMFSSNDLFQGNVAQGITLSFGAYLQASNSSFLNNAVGVEAAASTVRLSGGTISGSGGDGMRLLGGSAAVFQGPTITGNGGNGVHLEDGAFAGFLGANITGNLSGMDVDCAPQFPITRFVERTGGITNCVESASNSKPKTVE